MHRRNYFSLLFSLSISIGIIQCFHSTSPKKSGKVSVSVENPVSDFLNSATDSIEVIIINKEGDSLIVYQGTDLKGPWDYKLEPEDIDVLIIQYSSKNEVISSDQYSLKIEKNNFIVQPKIFVSPKTLTLYVSGQAQLIKTKVFPASYDQKVYFRSQNTNIVTISKDGVATGIKPGSSEIQLTAKNTATILVEVTVLDSNAVPLNKPVITKSPESIEVIKGYPALFNCIAEGERMVYQWQIDNKTIADSDQSLFVLENTTINPTLSEIRCIVSNSVGKDTSQIAVLTVVETGTVFDDSTGSADLKGQVDSILRVEVRGFIKDPPP